MELFDKLNIYHKIFYEFLYFICFEICWKRYTVDLVIFECLYFQEFLIFVLITKFRISEFSFFFSSSIMLRIFVRFFDLRIWPHREICEY